MKTVVSLSLLLLTIASCSQLEELNLLGGKKDKEEKDTPCPMVTNDSIPAPVTATFAQQYPNQTPALWCVDSSNYVAVFLMDSLETKAFIANNGDFLKEEIELDYQGNHEDDDDDDTGCECELPGYDQEDDD